MNILKEYIPDQKIIWLLQKVISSYSTKLDIGLPLGNLTSQLFANIYLNKFDQFVKHKLKFKHYIRYADDFVIFSQSKTFLEKQVPLILKFLKDNLSLEVHPNKIFIKTLSSGVDFLGWVNFFEHRVLRTKTKKRMFKRLKQNPSNETFVSYMGLLGWGNTYKIRDSLLF